MNIKDKTILITGASSGIGQAIAISCAKKGAVILINYRKHIDGANQTLKEVNKYSKGYVYQADLIVEKQISKMFTDISKQVGKIDILVNNAGQHKSGSFFDNQIWEDQFENIFFSALHVSQYFLKQNKESNLRKIINITSYYGNIGGGNTESIAYSCAKSAMTNMTVTLAKSNGKVLVNAIAPGYVWTPGWGEMSHADKKKCEALSMINRYINADEIALMAVGILENDAVTGQVINVEGGLSLKEIEQK